MPRENPFARLDKLVLVYGQEQQKSCAFCGTSPVTAKVQGDGYDAYACTRCIPWLPSGEPPTPEQTPPVLQKGPCMTGTDLAMILATLADTDRALPLWIVLPEGVPVQADGYYPVGRMFIQIHPDKRLLLKAVTHEGRKDDHGRT